MSKLYERQEAYALFRKRLKEKRLGLVVKFLLIYVVFPMVLGYVYLIKLGQGEELDKLHLFIALFIIVGVVRAFMEKRKLDKGYLEFFEEDELAAFLEDMENGQASTLNLLTCQRDGDNLYVYNALPDYVEATEAPKEKRAWKAMKDEWYFLSLCPLARASFAGCTVTMQLRAGDGRTVLREERLK
ncbi:MAG: hypothetical protein MI784_17850 [Cytophagales bacterium]|nr:hypothetical protein [Cytophagales bacterium]